MLKKQIVTHISTITLVALLLCAMSIMQPLSSYTFNWVDAEEKVDESKITEESLGTFKDNSKYEDRQQLYKELYALNADTAGWIYVEGTKVDNIVMQNMEEKDFYIDKDFNGDYFYPGTLYISDLSDLVKPTDVIIMYGHNMKDRSMFGSLREFEDPEFLKKHDQIILDNLEDRKEYEITHIMRIRVNVEGGDDFPYYTYSDFENEEEYNTFIEQCNEHALYDSGRTTEYGDRFVTLTTCEYTYADGTGRLVIMGKELQPEEPTPQAVTAPAIEKDDPISPLTIALICGIILFVIAVIILIVALKRRQKTV